GDPFEYVFKRLRIRIFIPLLKYGFRHAVVIQSISNFLAEWSREMGHKGEVEVVPNGVDVKRFQPTTDDKQPTTNTVLITTSRLVEKNAVGDIIDALKFLPESVSLKILGVGQLESELKLLAKNLPVEFVGFVPQEKLPEYLHNADIFIRPSLSEGQGISFIEAMAAGLPVIATPVGGIVDFLKNGETGLFCEVNNPESIAIQVKRLMDDNILRENIVRNARKMVEEKYDWDLIAKEMKTRVFDKV
ncbi:MAG: glycosyltransferase family 4 protein, partial [Minisyncoccia bacterium]